MADPYRHRPRTSPAAPPANGDEEFRPLPLLRNPHLQTLVSAFARWPTSHEATTQRIELRDGDAVAVEEDHPKNWTPESPSVLMIHGLCGCHRSNYMVRMARHLVARGYRSLRLNLRGCGSGLGWARGIYHSGSSADLGAVLEHYHRDSPASPITLIGFSLGGNIALKWAGESGDDATRLVSRIIAVSPPADLDICSLRVHRAAGGFYERKFISNLLRAVDKRQELFPDLDARPLPRRGLSLRDFDEIFTSQETGFKGASDYYARCSSAPLVPDIRIPCRVLLAEDDPFVDPDVFEGHTLPMDFTVRRTRHGGHLGFIGRPPHHFRWMDQQLLAWLREPWD